ncbi:hypothetical protein HDC94_000365 [Leifsonia sp. AK011]|uniref:LPXTG cell wall anchor domain-containing protein n=1 Tax=Leifsonia sp. AK011 TaxID=2723075 RepID=UPI0015CED9B2|nr:LPXTG cell wall anchor domain-containing protein [Leifsonia sp. AK011]NYF09209.1 hypothetical protein [Leifsonia sp. AK011]
MLKKFLAITSTVLLALGLSFVAVAAPASATHPSVSGTYACNPTTGKFDITWKVTGDTSYPNETATIKSQSTGSGDPVTTTPTLVGLTVKNTSYVTGVQAGVTPGNYSFKVNVQWTNHSQGDLVSQTGTLNIPSNATCYTQHDDTVDCTNATVYLNAALTNGNYINMTIRQNGVEKQTSAYVDQWQSAGQGGVANAGSGLVLRVTKLDGSQIWLPITVEQKNSGILTYNYSAYITGPFTVTWIQFDGHNWHFGADGASLTCGDLPKDASAAVVITPPTCEQSATFALGAISNATFGTPVITENSYSVVATANTDHLFPNGEKTITLSGPLAPKNTGGVCDDVTVALTITYVPECAVDADNTWKIFNPSEETVTVTYGAGQTFQATPGYSTLTTPRSNDPLVITWGADGSGVKTGTATGTPGADLTGEDEECYTSPDVTKVVGDCVYYTDGTAGNRTVKITYDNTDSNVPVTFSLQGFQGVYDRTVDAGESVVVDAPNVLPAGGTYTVIAAGKTFSLEISPCPTYEKPEPKVEQRPVASFDCDDTVVTIVTTTYTAEPVFDTETLTWGYGEWVEGESVTTTRAPLPSEVSEEGCVVTVTDPTASTCEVTDATELTSWIRIQLNANVEYRIDDVVVTDEFTSVTPGTHTVTATALNGYSLAGANPAPDDWTGDTHTWTFTAVDSAVDCTPEQPSLEGSFAAGECKLDAPWISWSVSMSDPDNQVPTKHATLVLSDGTNEQTIDLGDLVYNETSGKWELSGANLWPGASVDSEGNATGWPGWEQLSDGTWQETTGNFAWVRGITSATVHVNPSLVIDLAYPDATPLCDGPHEPPTLADVLPAYDSTPLTCTTDGSYTIGAEFGDVTWTVNGTVVEAGTYKVTEPTTITLVASPTNEDDTLNEAWKDEPVVLSFALPAGECASAVPPTPAQLAFTGAAASAGVVWAGLLVILTGLGLYFLRRKPTAD